MAKLTLKPVGGMEFHPNQLPKEELDAIKAVLAQREENREIVKLWWVQRTMSYFVLVDTPEGESTVTFEVPLHKIVEVQNRK